ncbi:SDR family oxidoreductase [Candidatus Lokiarchaeum ossiferum]|uniref:SDR family oxidoreductase n=1 Tax=Candidatus Lokiarchaeum ossiferum TaxID=2951803 RepID=UPI00352BEBEF
MNIFITGGNRGIGLEFVKQFVSEGNTIFASYRNPNGISELESIKATYPNNLHFISLEVSNLESVQNCYNIISSQISELDLLINCAGIISGGSQRNYPLGTMAAEDIQHVFSVNAISPLRICEQFLPLLEKSDMPRIVNISSKMGSIGLKTITGNYSYCASKSALNMFSKMMAIDLRQKNITVLTFHPGWVRTDMGGQNAEISPSESISGMITAIFSHTLEDSGKFLDWTGKELPW